MKNLLLFVLLPLLFVACQKEKKEGQDKQPPLAIKANLLSKVTYTNDTGAITIIRYSYDSKNRIRKKQYSLGYTYEIAYDAAGNLTRVKEYYETHLNDPDSTVTTYVYVNGLPKSGIKTIYYKEKVFRTIQITFEVSNSRITKVTAKEDKFDSYYYTLAYDAVGNIKTLNYDFFGVTTYEYSDKKSQFYDSREKVMIEYPAIEFYSPNSLKSTYLENDRGSNREEYTTTFGADEFPKSAVIKTTRTYLNGSKVITNSSFIYEYMRAP